MEQRRDPWDAFRLWVALTIGLYAIRATFVVSWPGAIPGFVLAWMVLLALVLALRALLWPGRVIPWRQGEGGIWSAMGRDWRHWWRRRLGRR